MTNNRLFDSTAISTNRTEIKSYIDEINAAFDTINDLEIFTCWSKFSNVSGETTTLKTKYEFIQSKIPTIKEALNSYIDFLTSSQAKYKELTDDIVSDIEEIINK